MIVSYENITASRSTMPNVPRPAASTIPGHGKRDASFTRVTQTLS